VTAPRAGTPTAAGAPLRFDPAATTAIDACRLAQLDLARADPRVLSIEADLGDCGGEAFQAELPGQYFDFGIAEASAIGAAAGLAMRGRRPFVNTFGAFALMRAAEQVRLDVCYHRVPVTIAGMFTGIAAGFSGPTHHAIEDVAIARALPGLAVIAPADAVQAYDATIAAGSHPGPVYLRLGVEPGEPVYREHRPFRIGAGTVLREGSEVTIVASGLTMVPNALAAAELLAGEVSARVVDLPTIKPLDRDLLVRAARETGLVVTVEEHSVIGGLGGAVAEALAEAAPVPLRVLGLPDEYCGEICAYEEHLTRYGLDAAGIAAATAEAWAATGRRH
jgi:transketolase